MLGLGRRGGSASSSARGAARSSVVIAALAVLGLAHWSGRWVAAPAVDALERGAPAPLQVEYALPTRRVNEADRLTIVLDRELGALAEQTEGTLLADEPFALEPALGGRWVVEDGATLAFLLEEPLAPGLVVRARPTPALETLAQGPVAVECSAEWRAPALALVDSSVRSADDHHLTLELQFNAPVAADALADALRFERARAGSVDDAAPGSSRAPADATLDLDPVVLTRTPTSTHVVRVARRSLAGEGGRGLCIVLPRGLRPAAGELGLVSDVSEPIEVPTRFSLLRASGQSRPEAGTLTLRFDRPLALGQEEPAVRVSPSVEALSVRLRARELVLEGSFEPGEAYTVEVPGSLLAVDGTSLQGDAAVRVEMPELRPRLVLPYDRGILRPGGALTLDVESLNVPSVVVTLERIHPDNFVAHVRGVGTRYTARRLLEEVFPLDAADNREHQSALDLRALIERTSSGHSLPLAGVYAVEVRSTANRWLRDRALVRITDLAPTVKRDEDGYHVWLRTLTESRTVEGARVIGLTLNDQLVTQGSTDVAGYAFLPVDGGHPDGEPYLLVVEHGEGAAADVAYVELPGATWSVPRRLTEGRSRADAGDVFVYPERALYRPGDVVHLTGIARTAKGAVHSRPLRLVIERPDGRTELDEQVQGDPGQGLWHASFQTDADARTGLWQVHVTDPSTHESVGRARFGVEAFLPARLRVAAAPAEAEDLAHPRVRVTAESLSGSPVEGFDATLAVHWTPRPFATDEYPDYSFERVEDSRQARRAELTTRLDADGVAAAEAPGLDGLEPGVWRGSAEWTVTEPGSRSATARVPLEVDTATQHLGLRVGAAAEVDGGSGGPSGSGGLDGAVFRGGQPLRVEAVAVMGARGRAGAELEAWISLERVTRGRVLERVGSRLAWEWRETVEPLWSRPVALRVGEGPASLEVDAPDDGLHRLTLHVEGGPRTLFELRAVGRLGATVVDGEALDSVEIRPSKPSAAPGELVDVVLTAPFDGSALVTLEDERVRWHGRVDVEGGEAKLQVPMPPDLRGGVLLSAQVTRPLEVARSLSAWAPHRSHGWARIDAEREAGRLDVSLSAPERVRPGAVARVTIAAERAASPTRAGEGAAAPIVHVWAVDEGLRIAGGDRRPSPRDHFHAPPAHATPTTDAWFDLLPDHELPASTTRIGGDMDEPGAARRRAPERVNRVPGVVWREAFRLGEDGRSTIEASVPDLVGELTWMAVVVDGDRYGDTQASSQLRGDIALEASAPRFAAPGDVFAVPVRLWNPEAEPAELTLSVECAGPGRVLAVSDAIAPRAGGASAIDAAARDGAPLSRTTLLGGERALRWVVMEGDAPGRLSARVRLEGRFEDGRGLAESTDFEVPLRSGRPAVVASYVASVDVAAAGGKRVSIDVAHELGLDVTDAPGESGRVEVSGDLGLSLGPATEYVAGYPYGCAEQTASRVLALALQAAQLEEAGLRADDSWSRVRAGVDRLWSMQCGDGGIGYWPGAGAASGWASVVVAEVLAAVQQLGADAPGALTEPLAEYLERSVGGARSATDRALYVRAAAALGRPLDGWTRRLEEEALSGADRLGAVGRAALAVSLARGGEHARARALLTRSETDRPASEPRTSMRYLTSGVRALADQLDAWVAIDPGHPEVGRLALALESERANGRWRNTVDNAAALRAMHRARAALGGVPADWSGELLLPGGAIQVSSKEGASASLGARAQVALELSGTGRAFVTAMVAGRRSADAPGEDSGLVVRRRWYDAAGRPLEPGAPIAVGDLVHVELLLATDGRDVVQDVAIVDPLAGGFEVENPRIAQSASSWPVVAPEGAQAPRPGTPDRVEFLDDRVLVFTGATMVARAYRYSLRAVAAGEFELGPVQAEAMYEPSVSSVGGPTRRVAVGAGR